MPWPLILTLIMPGWQKTCICLVATATSMSSWFRNLEECSGVQSMQCRRSWSVYTFCLRLMSIQCEASLTTGLKCVSLTSLTPLFLNIIAAPGLCSHKIQPSHRLPTSSQVFSRCAPETHPVEAKGPRGQDLYGFVISLLNCQILADSAQCLVEKHRVVPCPWQEHILCMLLQLPIKHSEPPAIQNDDYIYIFCTPLIGLHCIEHFDTSRRSAWGVGFARNQPWFASFAWFWCRGNSMVVKCGQWRFFQWGWCSDKRAFLGGVSPVVVWSHAASAWHL